MKNKNLRYIGIGIAGLLLLVAGIWMVKNIFPTASATREIMNILQPYLNAEHQSMHLELDMEAGEQDLRFDAELYGIQANEKEYLVIEQEQMKLFVVDNMILLENGKAFLLTEEEHNLEKPDASHMNMLPILASAFDEFQINRTEENEKVSYQIEVTGEQMREILAVTMPGKVEHIDAIEQLHVKLTATNGVLDDIQISGVADSKEGKISLYVKLSDFEVLSEDAYQIPQLIKDSVENVNKEELFCLTEDLYRLVKAIEPLSDMKNLKGTMSWKVSCGVLQINTKVDLAKLQSMKPEDNKGESEKEEDSYSAKAFIGLLYVMVMEGDLSCKEQNDAYVYELTLENPAMKELSETIAPEMIQYAVNFEKGSIQLEVEAEELSEITVGMNGSLNVLFTKVPVSFSVTLDLE